jgi:hypothetical protein
MVDPRTNDHLRMRLRAALRTVPLLAVAAAAGGLASGCGSGGAAAVLDPVANAAETTNNANGARVALHVAVTIGGLPQQISVDGSGHVAFKSQESELSAQVNGIPGGAAAGFGDGATIDERFVAGKLFMGSSAFAGKLPSGASWMEIDLAAAEKKLGLDPSSLSSGQTNPAQFLEYLKASGGGVVVTGTERVRGVKTTRYSGAIDLHKIPGADSGASKHAIEGIIAATGTSEIPVQAWVDSKKLVRKLSLAMPLAVAGQHVETTITEELFGFGPQPAVHAPAASETYAVPLSGLSSLGSGV